MIILNYLNPHLFIGNASYLNLIAIVVGSFGLILMISTIHLFKTIGKGTLAPWNPTQKLVIQGPYKYCRNPMITGVLCILIAEALWFNSLLLLIWMLMFFIISSIYFVVKEEPDLVKRFGNDYVDYKKKVPRWIPKLKPYIP